MAYAELYFTERFWPDFTTEDLLAAIVDYRTRVIVGLEHLQNLRQC